MRLAQIVVAALAAAVLVPAANAQCAEWDPVFGSVPGANGIVGHLAVFDDGSGPALYASGSFTTVAGVDARGLARWDGAAWSGVPFPGTVPPNGVGALQAFDDGSGPALYVALSLQGQPQQRLWRWNGASWSTPGPIATAGVAAMTVFDDGGGPALYVGGFFGTAGGVTAHNVARWDGTSWSAVGAPGAGFPSAVLTLAAYDDGGGAKLFAGGTLDVGGLPDEAAVARWDGTGWSALGGLTGFSVEALLAFDDGGGSKLYAGGSLYQNGLAIGVARWDGAGWAAPVGGGVPSLVSTLATFDDGSGLALYAGGAFSSAGGVPASRVARWDGASWSAVGGPVDGTNKWVHALAVYDAGSGPALYAGGEFTSAGGVSASAVAAFDGNAWSAPGSTQPGSGTDQPIDALCVFDDGNGPALYAGGRFRSASGVAVDYVAKSDGATWSAVGAPGSGVDKRVHALAVHDDGSGPALYAGGEFALVGGAVSRGVARWDGTAWSGVGGGILGQVWTLCVHDDGSGPALYAGGTFHKAGGLPARNVARWDGVSWSAVGTGTNSSVTSLVVHDDGSGPVLVAGGYFTGAGGLAASRVAAWDGSSWAPLDPTGGGPDFRVEALASHDDGSGPALYVGGWFDGAGGVPAVGIARWGQSQWSAVGPPSVWYPIVDALYSFDDGNGPALYAGGSFAEIGGVLATGVARWDGTAWSPLGAPDHLDGGVLAFAAFDDGQDGDSDLYLGGDFREPGMHAARWHGCGVQSLCSGDGVAALCPCGNNGLAGHGCDNSLATGGARLAASGSATGDTLVLTQSGELDASLSIFLQGSAELAVPAPFGDGVRCAGGALKRLYVANAVGGVVSAPGPGDPSIGARSAALGDPLMPGAVRLYQVHYRDPALGFCPAPQGDSWNVGDALRVTW